MSCKRPGPGPRPSPGRARDEQPDDFPPEVTMQLQQQLDQLNQQMKQLEDKLDDLEIERQAGPIEQASSPFTGGAGRQSHCSPMRSATASARRSSSPADRPLLQHRPAGQGPRAAWRSERSTIPTSAPSPGRRLCGRDESISSWATISPPPRSGKTGRSPGSASTAAAGSLAASIVAHARRSRPGDERVRRPAVDFDPAGELGVRPGDVQLEAGMPDDAAAHFTQALTLAPDLGVRPIAAYYLEKIGKPVPPLKRGTAAAVDDKSATKPPVSPVIPGQGPTEPPPPAVGTPNPPAAVTPTEPKDVAKTTTPTPPAANVPTPK